MNLNTEKENSFNPHPFTRQNIKGGSPSKAIQACCSRFSHCLQNNKHEHIINDDTFSINSELLVQLQPINISAEPLVQYEVMPEVDMLSKINIKQKKYQQMLKEYEQENKKKEIKERLNKIKTEAQEALKKSKGRKVSSPKNKWGHSLFAVKDELLEKQQKKQRTSPVKQEDNSKKIVLKPIDERIAQYRQKQAKKHEQKDNVCCSKQPNRQEVQRQNQMIQNNAQRILDGMKREKEEKQRQKKIIQAKIRALQIKAHKKVEISKKKPLEPGLDFDFADSEYSTFSARANNRKMPAKNKKVPLQPKEDPSLLMTKKANPSKRHKNLSKGPSSKEQLAKTVSVKMKEEQEQVQQMERGPFYMWNIPISLQDEQKLKNPQTEVFFNVDRFNYKSGKSFREEANEYLASKLMRQMEMSRVRTQEQAFWLQVQKKKELLTAQYSQQQQGQTHLNEPIWSEDELFKATPIQNFHFYTKNAPY